jgi:predicted O-methyltransferase YrrM
MEQSVTKGSDGLNWDLRHTAHGLGGLVRESGRTGVRQAARAWHRTEGAVTAWRLHPQGASSQAVATALRAALAGRPSPEERVWIRRIEAQRQAMLTSVQPLRFEDFGSGDDHEAVTAGQAAVRELPLGEMTARSSSSPRWGYLLFRLTRVLRPASVLELGTCVGVSAAYIASALELDGNGNLTTLEGGQPLVERSRHTLAELGLDHRVEVVPGAFADTLDDVLERISPVQLAFIDGHHQEAATLAYTEQVLPHLSEEAVLAYDDINWSAGMRRAWDTIDKDPRFAMTVDLGGLGLATLSSRATALHGVTLKYA